MATLSVSSDSQQNGTLSTAVQAIFTNLLAGGWVQTADTGQTTTVVVNGSGYQVWRMNDALQSTSPVYIKVSWGTSGVLLFLTVGTGSNGTGTITGLWYYSGQITTTQLATVMKSYYSSGVSRFSWALFTASTASMYFSLERTKDANGNDTSEGCILLSNMGTYKHTYYTPAATTVYTETRCFYNVGATTFASGSDFILLPVINGDHKGLKYSGTMTLVYPNVDLTAGSPITLTMNGATHTFLPTGISVNMTQSSAARFAMLYE
jgi:hypothetical protein